MFVQVFVQEGNLLLLLFILPLCIAKWLFLAEYLYIYMMNLNEFCGIKCCLIVLNKNFLDSNVNNALASMKTTTTISMKTLPVML